MKEKNKFDSRFFCVCGKCNNKIYEHVGLVEFPEGKFTLNVKCVLCGSEFQHVIYSPQAYRKMKMEKAAKMLDKDNLGSIADSILKKMGRDK